MVDRELLDRLKRRDAEAMDIWVDAYQHDLYRFLRHLTRHREAAEDLTQQTFVAALKGLQRFEGKCAMRTWMHRIAYHEYVAWRRKHLLFAPLPAMAWSRGRELESIEEAEVLLGALHKLSPALREAFLLAEVQELTAEEISDVTGVPVGTVKSRLFYARRKLQTMLGETFTEVCYEPKS